MMRATKHTSNASRRGPSRAPFANLQGAICACARRTPLPLITAILLLLLNASPSARSQDAPQPTPPQQPQYRVRVTSELVLVNVVVRDKKGNLVRDLKKDDFTLLEDGKRQAISTFDFENVDELATAGAAQATTSGAAADAPLLRPADKSAFDARDRRLMLLFFDFSGMDPEQIDRSVEAAKQFVHTRMQPADMIALVSLATNMRIDLDFTADKTTVLSALTSYTSGQGQGFDNGATGNSEGAAETDRKSTRLNSSHLVISYAVFCLKKKKQKDHQTADS